MQVYTRQGDKGETAIIGGRMAKDDTRVEAYGTVDELNGFVGKAITELDSKLFSDVIEDMEKVQHELFDCGGDLANITSNSENKLKEEMITYLEERIDAYTRETPDVERFILPGGSAASATLHIARTIARRAERLVVRLRRQEGHVNLSPVTMKYLNRLSDYFFSLARLVNYRSDVSDTEYVRSAKVFR